jgi:predicted DNA-binding transcriptional regulator AlpA
MSEKNTNTVRVDDEQFFTPEELAGHLKIKKEWLYQRIHGENLPFPYIKVGHYLRFPASGIRKYIQAQTKS